MWWRSDGPSATRRSRSPGQRCSSSSIAPRTLAASISRRRGNPGKSGVRVPGSRTSGTALPDDRDVDRGDRREVARDLGPRLALVGARVHLARARAEVDARNIVLVDGHALAEDAEV